MSHSLPAHCPNCSADATGPYCSQCGQETVIETPTLFEFVHEYLHHYVALEGKLWRSIYLLLCRPGLLTREYLLGRRKRYVKPLQLYITVSFLFFLAWGMSGSSGSFLTIEPGTGTVESSAHARQPPVTMSFNGRNVAMDREQLESFRERIKHQFPYMVFALMPVTAFILWLIYRRRGMRYGEHVLFSLHVHSFLFVLLLIGLLPLPEHGLLTVAVFLMYLTLALKQVYGGRFVPQLLRALTVFCLYPFLATLVFLLFSGVLLFTSPTG